MAGETVDPEWIGRLEEELRLLQPPLEHYARDGLVALIVRDVSLRVVRRNWPDVEQAEEMPQETIDLPEAESHVR